MKIQYLGTAAAEGWPALFCSCEACQRARRLGGKNIRTRSQAVIDDAVLLDFPADTYLHALQHGFPLEKIKTCLVTHSHSDHWYPMDLSMRALPYGHGVEKDLLDVYGNDMVESEYKKAMEFATYDFPVDIRVAFHQIQPFEPFESSGYTCTALLASHNRLERCYIYLVEKDGKSILYAHDTGYLPDSTWEYLSGRRVDLVSLDCNSMLGSDGYGHMGLPNDEKVREQLIEARCCDDTTIYVVNHFSHNSRLTHEEMVEAAGKKGFLVSYDGMTVEI